MRAIRMSDEGKVQIPAEVRKAMALKPGQRFSVVSKGDCITLVPTPSLDSLRGIAAGREPAGYRDRGA